MQIERSGLHDNWDDADGYYSKYMDIFGISPVRLIFIDGLQFTCYCINNHGCGICMVRIIIKMGVTDYIMVCLNFNNTSY